MPWLVTRAAALSGTAIAQEALLVLLLGGEWYGKRLCKWAMPKRPDYPEVRPEMDGLSGPEVAVDAYLLGDLTPGRREGRTLSWVSAYVSLQVAVVLAGVIGERCPVIRALQRQSGVPSSTKGLSQNGRGF